MNPFRFTLVSLVLLSAGGLSSLKAADEADRPPNFIIIFIDDMGYADIGPFGSTLNLTPNLDRLAQEGRRLTSFYAAALCTPSRAALLTGSYPKRVGLMTGSFHPVIMPGDEHGLNPDEITIAEILQKQNYATACIGKWHLGDQPAFLPTNHGFDEFYGIPYSNDMNPENNNKVRNFPPLPLIRDTKIIGELTDQSTITADLTSEAVRFITENLKKPFFLYLPHVMVHVPLQAGERFKNQSANGILGDAIEELDDSVGQILTALEELDLDDNTLILFTSDNGPARGIATLLRGKKGRTFEGGVRVPTLVRWPGKIPAGSKSDEITSTMDLLPTLTRLAGASPPADRILDGHNIWPILRGDPSATSPYDAFFYYRADALEAVRSGPWKLHLAGNQGKPALYNLTADIAETTDLSREHPKILARLERLLDEARTDLGDGVTHPGANVRPVGYWHDPKPLLARPDGKPLNRGDWKYIPPATTPVRSKSRLP
ncbi:sulfatase [Opitutaceae bacterium]|nr:sulfatase [Opitutaceae bacterium]MDB4474063.1 sulfatase [Opitutaceae bacterium]